MKEKLKLGVDLDHTCILGDILEYPGYDFSHKFSNSENTYYFWKRTHSDEFFAWACEHFDVYILTVASEEYAHFVIEKFGLTNKIKGVKSRLDWGPLQKVTDYHGDEYDDYIKRIDDFIVVDDKDYVIQGSNNKIIKVTPCWTDRNDHELLRVIKELETLLFEPTEQATRETFSNFYFFGDIFSNFHPCLFEINGEQYSSVEQFYMSNKAAFFCDTATHSKIMQETRAYKIKRLGNNSMIKGFNHDHWADVKREIMKKACKAKFSQNPMLKTKLLNTGNKILVEAAPNDLYWGTGIGLNDITILEPQKWRGKNVLGEVLMEVRAELKES